MRSLSLVLWLPIAALGCSQPLPAPTSAAIGAAGAGGAAASTSADLVCAHLLDLGCPEGKDTGCRRTLNHLEKTPIIALDRACILSAQDRPSARKCAGLLCLEPKP